ncbi:MAG: ADP-ribosylglycohydrolase family protein [Clostridia bacterium]|nr:ADP-ribosylglycohydrolase family protein [Clostridia bacterium]
MPGYADYKKLYTEEFKTLYDEGFDPEKYIVNDENNDSFMPATSDVEKYPATDDFWKRPYENLLKVMNTPIREGYKYDEPNDFDEIMSKADTAPSLLPISNEEYRDRIYGAFFGRCAGVVLGKPYEMGMTQKEMREFLESVDEYPITYYGTFHSEKLGRDLRDDCIYSTKDNVKFVQPDDDINYTLLGLLLAENKGTSFEKIDVGMNWLQNFSYFWCWCASRVAYYHLVKGDTPIDEIPYKLNPWRECIDGQIRTDIWGYIFPADHKNACKCAHKDCSLSLTKNGIYGGMFVAGALSAALSKDPTVEKIIGAGLASIPKKSRLHEAITNVCDWYIQTPDWEKVCEKIYEYYGHMTCEATINNMAVVALGIIAGELDYSKSICIANMCGRDTDCNAGTVGSIVGAAVGYKNIDPKWIEPLNDTIKSTIAAVGQCKISSICERIIKVKEKVAK